MNGVIPAMLALVAAMPVAAIAQLPATPSGGSATGNQSQMPPALRPPAWVRADQSGAPARLSFIGNRAVVEVRINGAAPYRMIVETGSAISRLSPRLVAELRLPTESGPGGNRLARADSVAIAGVVMGELRFVVSPENAGEVLTGGAASGGPVDGVLGLNLFRELLLTIDYPAGELRLAQGSLGSPDGSTVLRLEPAMQFWAFPMTLGGRPIKAVLDTQAEGWLIAPPGLAADIPMKQPPVPSGRARGAVEGGIGTHVRRSGRVDGTASVGNVVFEQPIIDIVPLPPQLSNWYIAGGGMLREFTVTLDQKGAAVRFERRSGRTIPAPQPIRSLGLHLDGSADQTRRAFVLDGSAASRAGIATGDEIVSVGGVPAAEVTPARLQELAASHRSVTVALRRGGSEREVTVEPAVIVP